MLTRRRPMPPGSLLILLGLLLTSVGLVLVTNAPASAQGSDQSPPEYVGSRSCRSCHRALARSHNLTPHALALQDASDKETIKADFKTGEKERTVQFPDDSSPRPFTADDVAYVIGSGRYVERYLYEVSHGKYAVFPAEWNVEKKAWQPYVRGGGIAKWPDDPAYDWTQNCAGCHTTGLVIDDGSWVDDGVQCEACHGPGSSHAEVAEKAAEPPSESDLKDIHAAIVLSPDSQICGRCHSQGVEPDSKLPFPVKYLPGLDLLDKGIFSLVPADSQDHWWQTGHAKQRNMQFNEWLKSGHAKSLATLKTSKDAAPACLECHSADYTLNKRLQAAQEDGTLEKSPLEALTLDTAKFSVGCLNCHDPHMTTEDEPVEFDLAGGDAYTQCVSCHRATTVTPSLHHPTMEMFEGRPIVNGIQGIPSAHFADAKGPRCQTCHMPKVPIESTTHASHTLQLIAPQKADGKLPDSCSGCHSKLTPADLQSLIDDTQDAVRARLTVSLARLQTIAQPQAGSVASAKYDQVVTALAFVQNEGSLGVHNYAYVDALLTASERALSELSVPGSSVQPTEAPAPTATSATPLVSIVTRPQSVPSGLRPMTIVSIGTVLLILLVGAAVFFRKSSRREA
jgi:cytochrome c554/c'-like protein/doubled CXXCH motif protein